MLVRLGGTFARLSAFISGTQDELLPVIGKVGGTVDRVNTQMDKVDVVTDSAVDAADSVDTAVRAVSFAITTPVKKLSGVAAALSYGFRPQGAPRLASCRADGQGSGRAAPAGARAGAGAGGQSAA